MADVDTLSRALVTSATRLADQAARLAAGVAAVTALVALSAYATGLAAFDGSARTTWLIVGGVLVIVVVGAPLLARWRLRTLHRDATELFAEVRSLLTGNSEARRVVIDIAEQDPATTPAARTGPMAPAMVAQTQRYGELRRVVVTAGELRRLPQAMAAVTTFPLLLAVALAGIIVFGLLGFVFLLIWVF